MKISKLSMLLVAAAFGLSNGVGVAKMPAPTPEAQAKADETKAKAAAEAELEKARLAKAQDRVAARYIEQQKAKGITVKPTPVTTAPASTPQANVPNIGVQKVLAPEGGNRQSAEAHSAPSSTDGERPGAGKPQHKEQNGKAK